MRRPTLIAALLLLGAMDRADAQTCRGAPSLREKPLQAGFAASFIGDFRDVGGTFVFGKPSLFGGGGVSATHIAVRGTAPTMSGLIGTEVESFDHPVFTCPFFHAGYRPGPDFGPIDVSAFGFQTGVSVGAIVSERPTLSVIPTVTLAVLYDRGTVRFQSFENSESVWSGVITFGAGFLFDRNLSVIPALDVPFNSGYADAGFSFRWVYGFGR